MFPSPGDCCVFVMQSVAFSLRVYKVTALIEKPSAFKEIFQDFSFRLLSCHVATQE